MAYIDPRLDHHEPQHSLPVVLRTLKQGLYTSAPGVVEEYDADTRRAKVRGALAYRLRDGTTARRPMIVNVPVIWPSIPGYVLHCPNLAKGHPVLLIYSMRGIGAWLETHAETTADIDGLLSEKDAMAIPSFGSAPGSPIVPVGDGITMQTDDGTSSVRIESGRIYVHSSTLPVEVESDVMATVKVGATVIEATPSGADITAGYLRHNGVNVGYDHAHSGVQSGGASTGPPS